MLQNQVRFESSSLFVELLSILAALSMAQLVFWLQIETVAIQVASHSKGIGSWKPEPVFLE